MAQCETCIAWGYLRTEVEKENKLRNRIVMYGWCRYCGQEKPGTQVCSEYYSKIQQEREYLERVRGEETTCL